MESSNDKALRIADQQFARMAASVSNVKEGNSKEDSFNAILVDMADLYRNKNADYGNSFSKSCDEFGLTSPIIRMSDKLNRLKTLNQVGTSSRVNEKIEDTLLDLANYAVMTLAWIKENGISSNK